MAGWAAPDVEKGGCAPPMAQAGCVGPDSRIYVRRLHLLAGHHVKVPDRCLRIRSVECSQQNIKNVSSTAHISFFSDMGKIAVFQDIYIIMNCTSLATILKMK